MLLTLGAKLDLISNRQAASEFCIPLFSYLLGSRSFDYNGIFFVIGVQFPEMGVLAPSFGVRKINMNKVCLGSPLSFILGNWCSYA